MKGSVGVNPYPCCRDEPVLHYLKVTLYYGRTEYLNIKKVRHTKYTNPYIRTKYGVLCTCLENMTK